MLIEIECVQCKKRLVQDHETLTPGSPGVTIGVEVCGNIDCCDCGPCEIENENKQLKIQLTSLRERLARIVAAEGKETKS